MGLLNTDELKRVVTSGPISEFGDNSLVGKINRFLLPIGNRYREYSVMLPGVGC
jgi:hypothetical protein